MKRGLIQWNKNEVPEEEFESRIEKTKAVMQSRGVDVVAIYGDACQSNNLSYLTNFFPYADTGLFVLPLAEPPRLFTTHAYRNIPWFNTITWVKDIVCADDIGEKCVHYLNAVDLSKKTIGLVNTRSFPHPVYSRLQNGLDCDFIDVTEDFEKIRTIKTKVEKKFIEKAAHIAALSFERVKKTFRRGISGYDLASEVELVARKNGAEDVLCLLQPDDSPYGLSLPTTDLFEMTCAVEISVEYQGCWAKMGRTLISADAPPEYSAGIEKYFRYYQQAAGKLRVGSPYSCWPSELRERFDQLGAVEDFDVYFDPGLEPYWGIHRNKDGVFQNDMAFHTRVVLRPRDKFQVLFSDTFMIEKSSAFLPANLG